MVITIDGISYSLTPVPVHVPVKDKAMEALIVLSPFAGPLLYAAAPDEANCVLVFDGTTNKLINASVKGYLSSVEQAQEALDNHTQWLGSLNEFKRTGGL